MIKFIQTLPTILLLIIATSLEVSGDAIIRKCIYEHTGVARIVFALSGMVLLFGYGFFLNLSPVEFGRIVGLYIATLFIVWQVISYLTFKSIPSLPVIVGGTLIVVGGLIVTFWQTK
ncbi:hypothetical protein [Ferruginibacter albus]|uniref:hypothetical protein n=1 Tax=Ferruginibacter albus TaxID=2875540 RepID=UPI001CC3C89A|nr:hypothetical protein [Ferruginibacter albus]UAY52838.1 hypothetical protein K9M53_03955 [Ferruginibacter albus]